MRAQDRARRAGTRPRSDHTLETALSILRDLARFLPEHRGKDDWALVDMHDVEAFLTTLPKARKRRLVVLRQFFRFARSKHIVLIDPTRTLIVKERNGFRGRTLTLDQQRELAAAGPPTNTSTRTRLCSACSPCCTAPPAPRSGCCRSPTSTRQPRPSGSASDPIPSHLTPPPGACCNDAWPTARHGRRPTRT
ncbi:site-specific integrase [Streptomyces actinomycinicus]